MDAVECPLSASVPGMTKGSRRLRIGSLVFADGFKSGGVQGWSRPIPRTLLLVDLVGSVGAVRLRVNLVRFSSFSLVAI